MEEKLIETGEKITQTQSDLEEAQAKVEQQYADMKVRIKYMYENGESDLWEVFLEAKDFSDFLNKAEYVSNVHSYDRQQLEELKKTQNEIQELKDTLETEQASLESQQADYEEQETQLNAQLEETKAQIADYDEQIQASAEAAAQESIAREADNTDTASEESSGGTTDGGSSSGGSGSTSNSGYTGSSSGNTSVAQTIVNAAYSQLGVPYVYGGTTAGVGFDCSGLVQYCHAVAGISLPRTSQAQGGCGPAAWRSGMLRKPYWNLYWKRADDSRASYWRCGEDCKCIRISMVSAMLVKLNISIWETAARKKPVPPFCSNISFARRTFMLEW